MSKWVRFRQISQEVSVRELILLFRLVVPVFPLFIQVNLLHGCHPWRQLKILIIYLCGFSNIRVGGRLREFALPIDKYIIIIIIVVAEKIVSSIFVYTSVGFLGLSLLSLLGFIDNFLKSLYLMLLINEIPIIFSDSCISLWSRLRRNSGRHINRLSLSLLLC